MATMDVRPEVQRKFLLMSMLSGPVAIVVAVLAMAYVVLTKPPTPTDVHRELTAYTNASYFARNYLLVWLGGSTRQQDNIMSMTSADPPMAPTGMPPPMTLPKADMSGTTPITCCAPPRATRNPVITSSKISSAP